MLTAFSVVVATKDNVADVAIWYRHDGAKRNLGVYAARGERPSKMVNRLERHHQSLLTMLTHLAFRLPLADAHDVGCKARRARFARFEGLSLFPLPTPQLRSCPYSHRRRLCRASLHCGDTNRQRLRRCLMPLIFAQSVLQ